MIYINNSEANIGIYNIQNYIATRIKSTLRRGGRQVWENWGCIPQYLVETMLSLTLHLLISNSLTYFLTTTLQTPCIHLLVCYPKLLLEHLKSFQNTIRSLFSESGCRDHWRWRRAIWPGSQSMFLLNRKVRWRLGRGSMSSRAQDIFFMELMVWRWTLSF